MSSAAQNGTVNFKRQEGKGGGGNITFIRPSKLTAADVGTLAEGIYLGSVTNNYDDTKLDYKIEQADGSVRLINSAGNLTYQMNNIEVGQLIQVNYMGRQEIKKGPKKGKEAHTFEVLVADEA